MRVRELTLPGRQKIKVAHVMGEFMRGGTERIVLDLLSRLDKDRFDIHVFCSSSEGLKDVRRKFEESGIETSVAATGLGDMSGRGWGLRTGPRKLLSLVKMARELKKGAFTIVHTHGLTNNLFGRSAAVVAGTPLIVTHEHNIHRDTRRDRLLWACLNLRTALNLSASRTVAEMRTRSVPSSRGKAVTLLNGIDLDVFHPPAGLQRAEARDKFGIAEGEKVIGTMGRLASWKRVDLFLKAAALALKRYSTARFLVVGDGQERPRLEELSGRLGITESVIFAGWAQKPEQALWAMDCFAIVSETSEGFGLVTAEAMACGLPVVAIDTPLNREVLCDRCGVFVSPEPSSVADGMLRLLVHDELAFAMGAYAARRASERYDIRRAANELQEIYERLVRKLGSPN